MREKTKQVLQYIQTLLFSVLVVVCFGINNNAFAECDGTGVALTEGPSDTRSFNDISSIITGSVGSTSGRKVNSADNLDTYLLNQEWDVRFDDGVVHGYSGCGTRAVRTGVSPYPYPTSTFTDSGVYSGCLCSLDRENWYVVNNNGTKNRNAVEDDNYGTSWEARNEYCRQYCPQKCAEQFASDENGLRTAMVNGYGSCPVDTSGGDITCPSNKMTYVDPDTGETSCINTPFTLNIDTSLVDAYPTTFSFSISAAGVFYVDWGDGTVQKIDRTDNIIPENITHSYSGAYSGSIRFGGEAYGYAISGWDPTISFNCGSNGNSQKITSISGSLGAIFETKDYPEIGMDQPMFNGTFMDASNMMGTIPDELFYGVHGYPVDEMFHQTFSGCSNLTGPIPETLFCQGANTDNINTNNCIYGTPAQYMFSETFKGCSNLQGSIPDELFAGIHGEPAESMFSGTFSGCSNLTGPIPETLFCQGANTYNINTDNCIYGEPGYEMFLQTFYGCSGLSGYVPNKLFIGISHESTNYNQMFGVFDGSGLDTECSVGMNQYITGFEEYFDGKVSCDPCSDGTMRYVNPNTGETSCINAPFTLNIDTSLGASSTFEFRISAAGVFYVDWGDGVVQQIDRRNNLTLEIIKHEYSGGYAGSIRFGGEAYGYNTDPVAAISFSYDTTITGITGSLGRIFGTKDNPITGIGQPRFNSLFSSASNMRGTIPDELFYGVHGAPVDGMFYSVFQDCAGLKGQIPETLFCEGANGDDINADNCIYGVPAQAMFARAFWGCSGLEGQIPETLFAGIHGAPAESMFSATFFKAKNLVGPIPAKLFAGIHGAPAEEMFLGVFESCSNLIGLIPETLFCQDIENPSIDNCIYGEPAKNMFYEAFAFSGVSGPIPEGLFAGIHGAPATGMFGVTFYECSRLSSYIPPKLFSGISQELTAERQMSEMFNKTGLDESCPTTMEQYITGFEEYFDGKVSCACPEHQHWSDEYNACVSDNMNIIYDYTNGGSGCANETFTPGIEKQLNCVPFNDGYRFLGWYDAVENGNLITSISSDVSEDITLYAYWESYCSDNAYWDGHSCVCKEDYEAANTPWIYNAKIDADDYEPNREKHSDTYYELRNAMRWRVSFYDIPDNREMAGIALSGRAFCSNNPSDHTIPITTTAGSDVKDILSGSGQYCWCKMTAPALSKWVFAADFASGVDVCRQRCPVTCGQYIAGGTASYSNVRKAIYDNILTFGDDDEGQVCIPYTPDIPYDGSCDSDKWFHVGDEKMCLLEEVQNRPALAVKIGTETYYLNMSDSDLPINSTSSKKMHVLYGGDVYNIHDNSVE